MDVETTLPVPVIPTMLSLASGSRRRCRPCRLRMSGRMHKGHQAIP